MQRFVRVEYGPPSVLELQDKLVISASAGAA
jgi:hypothetical protein